MILESFHVVAPIDLCPSEIHINIYCLCHIWISDIPRFNADVGEQPVMLNKALISFKHRGQENKIWVLVINITPGEQCAANRLGGLTHLTEKVLVLGLFDISE